MIGPDTTVKCMEWLAGRQGQVTFTLDKVIVTTLNPDDREELPLGKMHPLQALREATQNLYLRIQL